MFSKRAGGSWIFVSLAGGRSVVDVFIYNNVI